ncbi:MAG: DUF2339 domain-containing protein [Sphingomonas hengshuiensis]|uniref:DUF2339 domain-containing protein n=2 Tax=Sphingomonas TaxID=13687 RepID=A0A2W4Z3U3_9SPHN|nr:MAG: DUF2339 domain-containing protein [Sphingomonas hengshuiensis]
MTEVLLIAVIALSIALFRLQRRVAALEAREYRPASPATPPGSAAIPVQAPAPSMAAATPAAPPRPVRRRPGRPQIDFETLVGSRLPVWIGGLALVVGGIFLVRLSIEAGWLTAGLRTVLAALFALALLAGSEVARRLPATRDDVRIGQVLAGAGIASGYATLYLAAALYHLVGPLAGFGVMLGVTALGLFLALRHGPPTAVMALLGGFAAPLVAGYDAAGIGPLLIYLALFVAALLALAIARGWAWLALAALGAAFGWAGLLIALVPGGDRGAIGAFVIALAIGGTLAAPHAAIARPGLRTAPLLAALVLLLALAPMLDFSGLAWSFYLTLSAAALFLAWRDATLLPAGIAAALLVTLLVAAGLVQGTNATPAALPIALLLFAAAGAAGSRRAAGWVLVALLGTAGPLLAAQIVAPALLPPPGWMAANLALTLAAAALAWRHRDRGGTGDPGLVGGIAIAALGIGLAIAAIVPPAFAVLAPLAALGLLLAAARVDPLVPARLTLLPVIVLLALAIRPLSDVALALGVSLLWEELPYLHLPSAGDAARLLLLPALALLAAGAGQRPLFGPARRLILPAATAVAILGLYVLLKQPLAIASPEAFVARGFAERALLGDLALLAGWLLWTRHRPLATALATLALARILWFDLLGLNPVLVPQRVGTLPLCNAATLHLALAALLVRRLPGLPRRSLVAALLTLAATLATIRQIAHGTLLTGTVGIAENWGYSAAMLALAILWLWRGLAVRSADLRRFGLALLTLTTLKVFLIDASALEGVLRILSFMGLGGALIGIGWAYRRFVTPVDAAPARSPTGSPQSSTLRG